LTNRSGKHAEQDVLRGDDAAVCAHRAEGAEFRDAGGERRVAGG